MFRHKLPDPSYCLDSSEGLAAVAVGEGDLPPDLDMVNAGCEIDLWHPECKGCLIQYIESQAMILRTLANLYHEVGVRRI